MRSSITAAVTGKYNMALPAPTPVLPLPPIQCTFVPALPSVPESRSSAEDIQTVPYKGLKPYTNTSLSSAPTSLSSASKFISVNASWPGSCHDSHLFRTLWLCQRLERENKSFSTGVLLSDSGYPCRPFLITPFLVTDSAAKVLYQQNRTKTRVTIERAFGQLKRRFHILHSEMRLTPAKVCKVIIACVVLHNIAHFLHEPDIDGIEENDFDVGNERCVDGLGDGTAVRDFIVRQYLA